MRTAVVGGGEKWSWGVSGGGCEKKNCGQMRKTFPEEGDGGGE